MPLSIAGGKAAAGELSRLRATLDSTSNAIFLVEAASQIFVEVNATVCNMLGYSRDELLLLGPIDLGVGTTDSGVLVYGLPSKSTFPYERYVTHRRSGNIDA